MSQQQICIGDILEPFEELLGERPEPELLTLTEKNGFIAQSQKYNKRVARDDTSDYKVIRRFDIAFNPYLLWAGAIAQNVDWDMALISPLYPTFHVRNSYDPRFIDYLLCSDSLRLRYDTISFGSVPRKRRASVTDFLNLKLPKPPSLSKQQYIADILDRAEALRAKRREALAQLDELMQSIFVDMFGDPVENPKKLDIVQLKSLFSEKKDGTKCGPFGSALKKHEYVESGIPVWTMGNIVENKFVKDGCLFITEEKYQKLKTYFVDEGDILISRAGTVGKMCVVNSIDSPSIISTNLIRLSLNPSRIEAIYFTSLMTYFKGKVGRLKTGDDGAYTFMNTGVLKDLEIPLPPFELQRSFAKIMDQVENIKKSHQQSLLEINNLFDSLTHEAFTGKLFSHQFFERKMESEVKI